MPKSHMINDVGDCGQSFVCVPGQAGIETREKIYFRTLNAVDLIRSRLPRSVPPLHASSISSLTFIALERRIMHVIRCTVRNGSVIIELRHPKGSHLISLNLALIRESTRGYK